MPIDLHLHSTESDGMFTPRRLIDRAARDGLDCVALTDHDTTRGVPTASARAEERGVRFIPGAELTAFYQGRELHILAYFVDPLSPLLIEREARQRERVIARISAMIDRLRPLGVPIELEQALDQVRGAMPTRLHLARALVSAGLVKEPGESFEKWIGDKGAAYVPLECESPEEIYALIAQAGGVGGVAHPGVAGAHGPLTEEDLARHRDWGAAILEVFHPCHHRSQRRLYESAAQRLGLTPVGGSDFHTVGSYFTMGNLKGPLARRVERDLRRRWEGRTNY